MQDKPQTTNVSDTLAERGARYGAFCTHAIITQKLKNCMRDFVLPSGIKPYEHLQESQVEALEMIAHKIGRILNGDPNYADSWHDIAGYAKLVEDEINARQ